MRILFCSDSGDGTWAVAVLERAGHEVDWTIDHEKFADTLKGIVPEPHLDIPEDVSPYDLVVFDYSSHGAMADRMREVTPVIGSSAFAEKLEDDRLFGIEFMEKCGITVPDYEVFDDIGKAEKWLGKNNLRCVFKPIGYEDKATTYVSKSAEDMIAYLQKLGSKVKTGEFLLQEVVVGTEVSTNAWFTGSEFVALDHTLEEKKFMPGGLGPNTGCAGSVVWMPSAPDKLFTHGLARAREELAAAGFVGPIDLNVIATDEELFGLEWTPRFGYEGTCNIMRLLPMDFGEFLLAVASGETPDHTAPKFNFSATVRLSVPPYPNPSNSKKYAGTPVRGIDHDMLESFYLMDVQVDGDDMETVGNTGLIGAPIGCGDTIKAAFEECEEVIERLEIPDLQYRTDLEKCVTKRYNELEKNGWLRKTNVAHA